MPREYNFEQRDKIKRTAIKMFLKDGYDVVTTRSIAEECGIKRALLHYYYNQKELLLIDVYLDFVRESNLYFSKILTKEELKILSTNMFFRLFFGVVSVRPEYYNLYLPIFRDVNLIHKMLNKTIENHAYFLMEDPFDKDVRLAFFVVSGILSQMTILLSQNEIEMNAKDAVNYAMQGYYFYLGKNREESEKLISYTDSIITDEFVKNFIDSFERKYLFDTEE